MVILEKLYNLKSKIPKSLNRMIPNFLIKKLSNILFPYYFVFTSHEKLPEINYKSRFNLDHQIELINKFELSQKQNSFMTCPYLIKILQERYNSNEKFRFLDIGGANIDFFLDLKKNFINSDYYFFNLKSVNESFEILKKKYNYQSLFIINNIDEILNKNFDFVNFGSSIQYLDNYENILEKITNNNKLIMFSGQTLYNSKKEKFKKHLVAKQVKAIKHPNYCYFFNKEFFFDFFLKKKFNLVFQKKNLTDEINYKNFRNIVNDIEFTDFLFSKN